MKITYYPGCTLKTKAEHLNASAKFSAEALGIELVEPADWTCCGASYPLADDSLVGLVAPARILVAAKKDTGSLTTLCTFCYNVLRRTNNTMANDAAKSKRINNYLEEQYAGETKVMHFLEVLRDVVGFENLKASVKVNLGGLKIAPYYGCQLLKPHKEIKLDDPDRPRIIEDFLSAIGCGVADFPYKTECCGSYQIVQNPEAAFECSHSILDSAKKNGADAIVLTCPLCYYNMDGKQKEIMAAYNSSDRMPIFYFTELLALALGAKPGDIQLDKHAIGVSRLLQDKVYSPKPQDKTQNGSQGSAQGKTQAGASSVENNKSGGGARSNPGGSGSQKSAGGAKA